MVFEGGLTAGRPYWAPVQAALADVAPTAAVSAAAPPPPGPAGPAGWVHRWPP
ncbi:MULTISPECIES: hypothetical protein [Streptomyces]|uniref:hypothetical protein n=1 Tax=Streptomyces TaxID=1883 RepID=UPI001CEF869A|nr:MULTISPECIES: hypothetical protein [Streptomyces]